MQERQTSVYNHAQQMVTACVPNSCGYLFPPYRRWIRLSHGHRVIHRRVIDMHPHSQTAGRSLFPLHERNERCNGDRRVRLWRYWLSRHCRIPVPCLGGLPHGEQPCTCYALRLSTRGRFSAFRADDGSSAATAAAGEEAWARSKQKLGVAWAKAFVVLSK